MHQEILQMQAIGLVISRSSRQWASSSRHWRRKVQSSRIWSDGAAEIWLIVIASLLVVQTVSAQTLPMRPVVTIDGAMTNTNDELVKVTGARRLPDGRTVVAIGDPIELRVYDNAGKLLNRIGRKGGGPGEFRSTVSIPYADSDLIVTYSDNYGRFEVFEPSGKLIDEYEERAKPWPPPLLHRALCCWR